MDGCSVESCDRRKSRRGWCELHYQRWRRTGDPLNGRKTDPVSISRRFWAKVTEDPSGCWLWTAATTSRGYGAFNVAGTIVLAHRFAFEDMRGEIPAGLVLDHLCRRSICVNPDHLEPVTHMVNIKRGEAPSHVAAASGFCQRGHQQRYDAQGHARCLECRHVRKEKEQAGV